MRSSNTSPDAKQRQAESAVLERFRKHHDTVALLHKLALRSLAAHAGHTEAFFAAHAGHTEAFYGIREALYDIRWELDCLADRMAEDIEWLRRGETCQS